MKKSLIHLAVIASCSFAYAQEDPNVAAAKSANDAFVACITAVSGAASTVKNETVQAMMIDKAPDTCAKNVRVAPVTKKTDTAWYVWDGAKFVASLVAQYKGQALVWGAVQALSDRAADSTDNAVNQGFDIAGKAMDNSAAAAEAATAAAIAAQNQMPAAGEN